MSITGISRRIGQSLKPSSRHLQCKLHSRGPRDPWLGRQSAKLFALLVLGICFHGTAHAATNCAASAGLPTAFNYPGSVAVSSALQAGDTIPGTVRPFTIAGTCTLGKGSPATIQVGSTIVACTFNSSTEIMPGVYTTSVVGIGMRLRDGSGNPILYGSGQACHSTIAQIQAGGAYSFSGSLELVRIAGTIANGATLAGVATGAGAWAFGVYNTNIVLNQDRGNINTGNSSIYPTGNIVLRNVTCAVNYPPTVTLPSISASALASMGSSAGTTNINIGVNCNTSVVAGITLAPAAGISVINAGNGTLGLQSVGGGAAGVGVQIIDQNRNPVPLQARNNLGAVTANTPYSFRYFARYIRVGAVAPGSVASAMVFTMDYQ